MNKLIEIPPDVPEVDFKVRHEAGAVWLEADLDETWTVHLVFTTERAAELAAAMVPPAPVWTTELVGKDGFGTYWVVLHGAAYPVLATCRYGVWCRDIDGYSIAVNDIAIRTINPIEPPPLPGNFPVCPDPARSVASSQVSTDREG